MIKLPIIITETNPDVFVFQSIEQAQAELEVWDVAEGIYSAYDSDGHILRLRLDTVERPQRFLWFKWTYRGKGVIIEEQIPEIDGLVELREKLTDHLVAINKKRSREDLEKLSLEELILMVSRRMPWSV